MSKEGNKTFVRVTQQDIYEKLVEHTATLQRIETQALKTNGRVTHLEEKSTGLWIERNPYKFAAIIAIICIAIVSVDSLKDHLIQWLKLLI